MPAPIPIRIYHFTPIDHLPSIMRDGLLPDAESRANGSVTREAGEPAIKERRRRRVVPVGRRGMVGDYVPFYFAPRSPMLFRIAKGGVPSYTGTQGDLIYLCSTVERLEDLGLPVVLTDRNAVLDYARFAEDRTMWSAEGFVDWHLMTATYWNDTDEYPDRKERRMAECLVHRVVPWDAILAVGAFEEARKTDVERLLAAQAHVPPVHVRRDWYF